MTEVKLEAELVFEEILPGSEHRVHIATAPHEVPFVTLPKLPGDRLTAVIHEWPGAQPVVTAFYTSERMARLTTHLATDGFKALCLLHDAAEAMRPVTAAVKALATKDSGRELAEQMETALAEAKRALDRATELADGMAPSVETH